jgi:hypothetical protein
MGSMFKGSLSCPWLLASGYWHQAFGSWFLAAADGHPSSMLPAGWEALRLESLKLPSVFACKLSGFPAFKHLSL